MYVFQLWILLVSILLTAKCATAQEATVTEMPVVTLPVIASNNASQPESTTIIPPLVEGESIPVSKSAKFYLKARSPIYKREKSKLFGSTLVCELSLLSLFS